MNFLINKKNIILYLLIILLSFSKAFSQENTSHYKKEDIMNYFLGIVSSNQNYDKKAFKYLKKVKLLNNEHSEYNKKFLRTLVLVDKFEEAIKFSKKTWAEDELFFEADLLLGLDFFIKNDYKNAEKHFKRLNTISSYNFFFNEFIGNILLSWSKAAGGEKQSSYEILKKIPKPFDHLKKTQYIFLNCYHDAKKTEQLFLELINNNDYDFSRYNYFLVNYFLQQNKHNEAKNLIIKSRKKSSSNLLLRQTENYLINGKFEKAKSFFNCKNPKDSIAEFFYILANLYSSERDYKMSNFYLKISLTLNEKFIPNNTLLAENYYYQNKNDLSKNIYFSLKLIGDKYSWYAAKSIAKIINIEEGKEESVASLEKEFNLISNLNFEHFYELANFYKDYKYNKKAIKYYSLALENVEKNHPLIPKILDRRGTSYEQINQWKNAEQDLKASLNILPNQAHVLNYLAYSWVDKGINIDEGIKMLIKADQIKEDDGYITDSLGWAYYAEENYTKAEYYLQKAVELLPFDPVITDHYADVLWMLNKDIQARYFWKHALQLEETKKDLKKILKKKIIFGIKKNNQINEQS